MTGEPKTLWEMTPREAWEHAWEQAIDTCRVFEEEATAGRLEVVRSIGRQFLDQDAGVRVAARDEAAELRAAAIEWAQAYHAASDAHTAWLSEAAKGGASYTGGKAISRSQKRWAESLPSFHAWVKASAERHTAKERLEALARRLAGGENEQ